jgi:cytochrome c peroxidase
MLKKISLFLIALFCVIIFITCKKTPATATDPYAAIKAKFGTKIDPNNLLNYAGQTRPAYITKDNSGANPIDDKKATLGRVLFYDKSLSIDNSVSCGSCHKQEFAFSDTAIASAGVQGGRTGRHSMRLINSRFASEIRFFWDERAASLEAQTTQPIQDHAEMGFSGQSGRPGLNDLISKLSAIDYYKELFQFVYGSTTITEAKMQEAMANFIRSIQSFDSKYDAGRATVTADGPFFPNFTTQENIGKALFLQPPTFDANSNRTGGGLGCQGCHRAPEFDILPNSGNNGIIGKLNAPGIDITVTRAPTLRDLVRTDGSLNGALMHTGNIPTLQAAIGHYGTINIAPGNTNLDVRLRPNGIGQKLNLTATEVDNLQAFLRTLSGTNVYTDVKWSNPF